MRIFVEERFFVLEWKLEKILQQKFSSLSSNVDMNEESEKYDAVGSDGKNNKDVVGERNDIFYFFILMKRI